MPCKISKIQIVQVNHWLEGFQRNYKKAKYIFFNNRIQEIATKNQKPWDLINWVKKRKFLTIEVLHQSFNLAQNCQVNSNILKIQNLFKTKVGMNTLFIWRV